MGIRMDQPQGLSPEAELFLKENAKKSELKICSECKHQTGGELIKAECGRYAGMFADNGCWATEDGKEVKESDEGTYPLYRYELNDDGYAEEYEQCAPWSSGPVIFLGLKIVTRNDDEKGGFVIHERKIEWSDIEIEESM